MKLTSEQREEVLAKSEGNCWYCGDVLTSKRWHADHIEPVYRQAGGEMVYPHRDRIENIVPSCVKCNSLKSVYTLEQFREQVSKQVERANKNSVNFRTALRFGMVEIVKTDIVFAFERNGWSAKKCKKVCAVKKF